MTSPWARRARNASSTTDGPMGRPLPPRRRLGWRPARIDRPGMRGTKRRPRLASSERRKWAASSAAARSIPAGWRARDGKQPPGVRYLSRLIRSTFALTGAPGRFAPTVQRRSRSQSTSLFKISQLLRNMCGVDLVLAGGQRRSRTNQQTSCCRVRASQSANADVGCSARSVSFRALRTHSLRLRLDLPLGRETRAREL